MTTSKSQKCPTTPHLLVRLPLCVQRLVLRHTLPAVQLQRDVVEQLPQHTGRTARARRGGGETAHITHHTAQQDTATKQSGGMLSDLQAVRHFPMCHTVSRYSLVVADLALDAKPSNQDLHVS